MTADEFAHAIAIVETGDKEFVWGDSGLAMGRYQCHPAWYQDWAEPNCPVDASWDARFRAAVMRFYNHYQPTYIPLKIAVMYNQGVHAVTIDGKWNAEYASKFCHAVAVMVEMSLMAA